MTAILSTVGAMFSFEGGATQNEALLLKNDAAIKRTEATDQWSYYQAKGSKQNLASLGVALTQGEQRDKFTAEAARYEQEKETIRKQAESLEKESKSFDEASAAIMHRHHYWAQATTALQIAIALAAITLLTRKKWLEYGVYVFAGLGVVVGAIAWFGFG